jgi:hypothetical protein
VATEVALKRFQRSFRLEETGALDERSIEMLQLPRCGVPDVPSRHAISVTANFALVGCSYESRFRTLTYAFLNGTPKIPGDGE